MKKSSVLFRWFLSYLFIVVCSICFGIALYFYTYDIVEDQSAKINQMLFDKLRVEVDGYIEEIIKLQEDLIMDKGVRRITALNQIGLEDQEVLLDLHKNMAGRYSASNMIDDMFIYLKKLDTVIGVKGHMSSRLFYDLYYANPDNTYEEVAKMFNQTWNWDIVPLTNSKGQRELVFLQTTLNYESGEDSATIAVTIKESTFQQWFYNTKWDDSLEIFMLGKDGLVIGADNEWLEESGFEYGDKNRPSVISLLNKKYVVASMYSQNSALEYIHLMPESLLKNEARKIQVFAFIGSLVCFTVGMIAAYYVSKIHYKPLRLVMEQFRRNGADEFEVSGNEFQWLMNQSRQIHEERKDNKKQLKRYGIYHLITRPWLEFSNEKRLEQAGIRLEGSWNLVVLAGFALEDDHELIRFALANIFEELAHGKCHMESTAAGEDLAFLMNMNSVEDGWREWLEVITDETQKKIKEWFGVHVLFFAGSMEQGTECIYNSYLHAEEAAGYRGLAGVEALIWYEDIENRQLTYRYSLEEEQKIINTIRVGNSARAKEYISNVFKKNIESKHIAIESRGCLLYDLLGTLMRGADAGGLTWPPEGFDVKNQFSTRLSNEVLEQNFRDMTEEICDQILKREEDSRNDCEFGGRIMEYVKQHYQNPDLNISITALEFGITPAYLSSLFKEQTGMGLLEFISHIRIEKATELLKQGSSVAETAEKTGFRGSVAFIRVFKKATGITPGQMKKMKN